MKAEERYPLLLGYANGEAEQLESIKQVAGFICKHGLEGDVIITQPDGTPFLDTFGIYINRIADMEYREELLKVLIPMQQEVEQAVLGLNCEDDAEPQMGGM